MLFEKTLVSHLVRSKGCTQWNMSVSDGWQANKSQLAPGNKQTGETFDSKNNKSCGACHRHGLLYLFSYPLLYWLLQKQKAPGCQNKICMMHKWLNSHEKFHFNSSSIQPPLGMARVSDFDQPNLSGWQKDIIGVLSALCLWSSLFVWATTGNKGSKIQTTPATDWCSMATWRKNNKYSLSLTLFDQTVGLVELWSTCQVGGDHWLGQLVTAPLIQFHNVGLIHKFTL